MLKHDQWYQLPNGAWCKADLEFGTLGNPHIPLLHIYGHPYISNDTYCTVGTLTIAPNGELDATGTYTWDTWKVPDLREATPDEAEYLTHKVLGITQNYAQ